ncbi:MAG: MFS transporter [Chloroflexota bacterium]
MAAHPRPEPDPAPGDAVPAGGRVRVARVQRSLPAFVRDLLADRAAMRTLVVASAAIAAAGLDPHILDPGMPAMRSALAADPALQGWFLLAAILQSGFILLGGFLADTLRSVRLLQIALLGLAVSSVAEALTSSDAVLYLLRIVAWACDGVIITFAIGAVAASTAGENRATALGVAYGVLGATMAVAPALAIVLGEWGAAWPAFLACGTMSLIALRLTPRLPVRPPVDAVGRATMATVTLFAFGVVAFAASAIDVTAPDQRIRDGGIAVGIVAMAGGLLLRLRGRGQHGTWIGFRPVTVALGAGVVIGFAQAAPLLHLPIFFEQIQGHPQLLAIAGIAPFVVALLIAGPLSGLLLERFRPRTLIAGGLVLVGVANLLLWEALSRDMPYVSAIVPFVLIGAGFVIATTVRTAVIFANLPRGMPAIAAGFNEASIGVGSRLGIVVATVVTMQVALAATPVPRQGGLIAAQPGLGESTIRELVLRIGLPGTRDLAAGLDQGAVARAFDAIVGGMATTELVLGLVAIATGIVAWLLMGRSDPVGSVWEYADERAGADATPVPARPVEAAD